MKKLLLMAAVCALLNGCNSSSTSTASAADSSKSTMSDARSKEERNKEIIRASMKAYGTGNVDETLKDAADDIVDYGDGSHPPIKGLDSLKVQMKKWMDEEKAGFPDAKGDKFVVAASGDSVLAWFELTGTWKGTFMGQKPTGKSYKVYGVNYFLLNDAGKVVEHHGTPANAEVARQIGLKM